MKIRQKINMDFDALLQNGAINIVVFGDSVTHGALGKDEIDYDTVYHTLLRKKNQCGAELCTDKCDQQRNRRGFCPKCRKTNGTGCFCASSGSCYVCFGLNDVNLPLEDYIEPCKES